MVLIVWISLWDCLYCLVYLCCFGLRFGLFGCSSFHCSNSFFECLDSLDCVYCLLNLLGLFALCVFFMVLICCAMLSCLICLYGLLDLFGLFVLFQCLYLTSWIYFGCLNGPYRFDCLKWFLEDLGQSWLFVLLLVLGWTACSVSIMDLFGMLDSLGCVNYFLDWVGLFWLFELVVRCVGSPVCLLFLGFVWAVWVVCVVLIGFC